MDIIKELDLKWFWLGYSCGSNSRKRIIESPNKLSNLGKQGVITVPTEKQKISFFIGVKAGRGKLVQNMDIVRVVQFQDSDSHGKGKYLTASIGSVETVPGATITLPFYISNNSVDNRGYAGFQFKIKYPTEYLRLNSISPCKDWMGSFNYSIDAASGIVMIQGLQDSVAYDDKVFGYMSFTLGSDVPNSIKVNLMGPTGQGTNTDILTKINGELYYIQPLTLESGEIKIPSASPTPPETKPEPDFVLPPIGSGDDTYGEDLDLTYDFDLDLGYVGSASGSGGGGSGGAGANLGINITFGDGSNTTIYIPLEEGSHHYNGKIPIKLPSLKPGPIIIEIFLKPNDDDDLYYYFLKAGALWGFETEIPREEVGELPIIEPKKDVYEYFILNDGFIIESISPTPIISDVSVDEIMHLLDGFNIEGFKEWSNSVKDALWVFDGEEQEKVVVVKKDALEDFLISDGLEIEYFKEE